MDDLISRQEAIDSLFELYEYQRVIDPTEAADLVRQGVYLAEKKIEQLPSAQSNKNGHWWKCVGEYRCSKCYLLAPKTVKATKESGYKAYKIEQELFDFCPHCGADMRNKDEA